MRILILGAGALGSNLTRLLVPDLKGEHEIEVLDMDDVEERNVQAGTQFYTPEQIGLPKVEALQYNIYQNYGREITIHYCEYPAGFTGDIGRYDLAIDCFDNSESRRAIQDKWSQRRIFRDTKVQLLHAGFSDQFTFAIEWGDRYTVPSDITSGMDICEMEGAATFVTTVASLTSYVVQEYINNLPRRQIEIIGNQLQFTTVR